jgi:hypothetical protein
VPTFSVCLARFDPGVGLSFAVGTVLFLVGREAHAYTELKSEVAGLKEQMTHFKRASAEQMTFVRQATKQLVDLSAAHTRLEEEVRAGAGSAASAEVMSMGGVGLGAGVGVGEGGDGGMNVRADGRGGGGGGGSDAVHTHVRQQQQRQRGQAAGGGGGGGGGGGNLRGGGGTSSDDGLWETSGSEASAAGGLARTVKEGELPWDG